MTEQILQKTFHALRNAPSETSLQDVISWLDAPPIALPKNKFSNLLKKTNLMTLPSITAVAVTGLLLLTTNRQISQETDVTTSSNSVDPPKAVRKTMPLTESSVEVSAEKIAEPTTPTPNRTMSDVTKPELPDPMTRQQPAPIAPIDEVDPVSEAPAKSQPSEVITNDPITGSWSTKGEKLKIDTLFEGINKIIVEGKMLSDIKVIGSNRKNVSMSFDYSNQSKGIQVGKMQHCEVRYVKTGGTLRVISEIESSTKVFIGSSKLSSRVIFEVPEDVEVQVNTSYGDISVTQLSGKETNLKTSYGDVVASQLSGNLNIRSGYGDVKADHLIAKIDLYTKYGDISLSSSTAIDSVSLFTGYGDVQCQLRNPHNDCRLELRTGYGKIQAKGTDLNVESSKKLQFGSGKTIIKAESNFGDVSLLLSEK